MELNMANYLRKTSTLPIYLFVLLISFSAKAQLISLKDHYPQKYVVQPGDTLYEIAAKYLNKPWEWKKIWRDNPRIKNPSRLYPGAILTLRFFEGAPYLTLLRRGTYKLSPHARPRPSQEAIPPVFLSDILPFLNGSRVFDYDELKETGYVVGYNGEHLIGGQNDEIYVKDLRHPKGELSYALYRSGGVYTDPNNPDINLGYVAIFLGEAQLIKYGEPATLELTSITQGIRIKDRVIPNNKAEFKLYFEPQAPDVKVNGEVIDLINNKAQVATNQIIVINKGKKDHMTPGDVIAVWQHPRAVEDPLVKKSLRSFWGFTKPDPKEGVIILPKERIGEAMIFRTFTHVSYALIVRSTRAINKKDLISNP
jgi:hypothetical protein